MDNLVKTRLMTKPMVTPLEPVQVVIQGQPGNIKGVELRDVRRKNADYDINDLVERLKAVQLIKVSVKHPMKETEIKTLTSKQPLLPPSPAEPPKKIRRLVKKKLVIIDDDKEDIGVAETSIKDGKTDVVVDELVEKTDEEKAEEAGEAEETRRRRRRITPKPQRGVAELGPEDWVSMPGTAIAKRLPSKEPHVKFRLSSYYMNNRKIFVNFINSFFQQYKNELEEAEKGITCDSLRSSESFSLLTHQKLVRDYMNLYTPYRGLLLYHGLGAGKTASSIAIAEGMKSKRRVIVMTPKSLRDNYVEELKKAGDFMYKKKQYWEWVHDASAFETLSAVLQLPIEYIERNQGAWLMDVSKPVNTLSTTDMKSLDDQLNEMIFNKYKFIAYNGLREQRLKEMTDNYEKNPFDNAVVIIDEAHNFISRIVNKIQKERPIAVNDRGEKEKLHKAMSLKLYEFLMSARNARIVLLTGTPIINYPNEIGILFNILRGYIKTWEIPVVVKTTKKVSTETLQSALAGEKILDYLEYSPAAKKVLITRNPFGFKNKTKERTGYHGVTNQIRDAAGDAEFDTTQVSDIAFEKKVMELLEKEGLEINQRLIRIHNYKALPDVLDKFVARFIDPNTQHLKDAGLFKKRIIGLTSYYRSPQEGLMPRYEKTPEYYHVVKIPMSNYQFNLYEASRVAERKQEKSSKTKKGTFDKDGVYKEPSSTYRIFSRLFCNFVMPPDPGRPMPQDTKKVILGQGEGDEKSEKAQEELIAKAKDKVRDADLSDEREGEIEGDEAITAVADKTYTERIQNAIAVIRANAATYLSKQGLERYSPKFLHVLENIQDPEYVGLHLVYSQFRTLEGLQLLTMVLEANGFARFRLKKTSNGGWDIDIPENDQGKPTFALYTGTESDEEKKLILKIYNGFWDDIPTNIAGKLRAVANNNNLGEIIKVFMITSSGSEGLNLRNTRYVHVVEPYWHPVRTEQVIGRARRICSHKDLELTLQTVEVFVYLMTFTEQQIEGEDARALRLYDTGKHDPNIPLTSDEYLYEVSSIKEEISNQLTIAIKEAAIDCQVFSAKNAKEGLDCLSFGDPSSTSFAYNPDIDKDEDDTISSINTEKITWKAEPVTIYGIKYAARKMKEREYYIYDLQSYIKSSEGKGTPARVGTLEILPGGKKIFNTLVT